MEGPRLSESTLRALNADASHKQNARPRLPSVASNASTMLSRLESETDFGGEDTELTHHIHSPKPRYANAHAVVQPWLSGAYTSSFDVSRGKRGSALTPTASNSRPRGPRKHTSVTLRADQLDSPLRRWIRFMGRAGLKSWIDTLVIALSLLVRVAVGMGGFSGRGTPPMYGDYEAQRHWMEITSHLPMKEWYFYDLQYWGLDYPPLTAYVSFVCGWIGNKINPSWFALASSRGYESAASIAYMRLTVIALEVIVYFTAVVLFSRGWWAVRSHRTQATALATLLLQPALLIIDHGHFQYNSVMLGLTLWSVILLHKGHDAAGAMLFVLSLGFKQMALYYSPAIFGYLFGKCLHFGNPRGVSLFTTLAITGVGSLSALFLPFLQRPFPDTLLQPFIRIFPFARGLFEDKVANFWCASNVIVRWRERSWAEGRLPTFALLATVLGALPSMMHLIYISYATRDSPSVLEAIPEQKEGDSADVVISPAPTRPSPAISLLPIALFNSAMAFFLFSFQVHEKSILLPLIPFTLVMSAREDSQVGAWEWGVLVNNVAMFSMWPLLSRDGQILEYFVLIFVWNYLIGYNPLTIPRSFVKLVSLGAYSLIVILHLAEYFVSPPARYPDLWPVLNVLVCTPIFGLGWLWGLRRQLEMGWGLIGLAL